MFWFVKIYLEDQTTLNHLGCFHVKGAIRLHDLERAVFVVGQRHEALRSCYFTNEKEEPVQGVMKSPNLYLEHQRINSEDEVGKSYQQIKIKCTIWSTAKR